jgi:NADPH-dependent F420 reductase
MQIALLGGTGDIGEGLTLRWALDTDHELIVGSRDPEKAERAAANYRDKVESRGEVATLSSGSNPDAVVGSDLVVLSVPPEYVHDTVATVAEELADDAIVICPAVAMNRDSDGFHYEQPAEGDSITAVAHRATPDPVATVGAFHNIPAGRLSDLDAPLNIDTIVLADDDEAAETVIEVAESIEGLSALRGGPLANAPEVEGITPLLINIAMNNDGLHNLGLRFE